MTFFPSGLQRPNATDLTLYKNGIMWKRGPFRRFTDPGTKQCVVELMNGFFPQEQLDKDKKACPINVMDKRDTSFIPRTVHSFFPGEGKTVGDSGNPTKVTPASENAAAKPSGKVTSIPPGKDGCQHYSSFFLKVQILCYGWSACSLC